MIWLSPIPIDILLLINLVVQRNLVMMGTVGSAFTPIYNRDVE